VKRGKPLKRNTPLRSGKTALARTRLNTIGKRRQREAGAAKAFSEKSLVSYQCEACGYDYPAALIQAHHVCSRARGVGHANLHHLGNRAWLCSPCHDAVHRGLHPHLLKSRDFLDTL